MKNTMYSQFEACEFESSKKYQTFFEPERSTNKMAETFELFLEWTLFPHNPDIKRGAVSSRTIRTSVL